jgi:hypothetical protein
MLRLPDHVLYALIIKLGILYVYRDNAGGKSPTRRSVILSMRPLLPSLSETESSEYVYDFTGRKRRIPALSHLFTLE